MLTAVIAGAVGGLIGAAAIIVWFIGLMEPRAQVLPDFAYPKSMRTPDFSDTGADVRRVG
jgi:hypothetical protein